MVDHRDGLLPFSKSFRGFKHCLLLVAFFRRPVGNGAARGREKPQDSTGYIKLFVERSKRIVSY